MAACVWVSRSMAASEWGPVACEIGDLAAAILEFSTEICTKARTMASVIGTLMPSVASVYLCLLSNSSETGILTSPE